jgi:beta-glucanase (GH16 family)
MQDNGTVAPNYTEIDAPEFEGQGSPGLTGCSVGTVCAEFTNWTQPDGSHNVNVDSTVATGDSAFHVYSWVWTPGQIIYKIDGSTIATKTTFVPSAPAYVIFNHYGTNSSSFGGVATTGVTRWQYVSNFTFIPQ